MKLYINTTGVQFTVSKDPAEKVDQAGKQKSERGTGRPMWATQVFALDSEGGEVINVTTAGEKPKVTVGQLITFQQLEAIPWATNGRNGTAYRAADMSPATGPASSK